MKCQWVKVYRPYKRGGRRQVDTLEVGGPIPARVKTTDTLEPCGGTIQARVYVEVEGEYPVQRVSTGINYCCVRCGYRAVVPNTFPSSIEDCIKSILDARLEELP